MGNESVTADFGKFPNVPDHCRYGAAMLSNDEWIVWDYREGRSFTPHGTEPEQVARQVAENMNRPPARR